MTNQDGTHSVMLRYSEASHVPRARDERSFAALRMTSEAFMLVIGVWSFVGHWGLVIGHFAEEPLTPALSPEYRGEGVDRT